MYAQSLSARLGVIACVTSAVALASCSLDREALIETKRAAGTGAGIGGSATAGSAGSAGSGAGLEAGTAAGSGSAGTLAGVGGAGIGGSAGTGADACGGCDDGMFCNGVELCAVGDPAADARGCITTPSCLPSQTCDEIANVCATDCSANGGDADGDGFISVDCGGDDCNDASIAAYPSGIELCDGLDNDCSLAVDDGFAQFSCLRDNTLAACILGQCVITMCDTSYADCDGLASNGCEAQLDDAPGDCKARDCSGAAIPNDADTPDDDNDCTTEYCSGGKVMTTKLGDGASCDGGNGTCESGKCVRKRGD